MSGLFNTFNIVKRGMFAQQTALNVVSHNVANANTEGYSVQRANLKTSQPFGMPSLTTAAEPGQIGTGVEVASITRTRDEFLDYYIRKETSTLKRYETREYFLSEIEAIFTEPSDTGIATLLSNFWDAWQGLATNPESSTARTLVISNAEALAHGINQTYIQLEDREVGIADLIQQQIFEVSNILTQIADLNEQIKSVVIGGKIPNDLLDRRDLLLDKLSERFDFDIKKTDYMGIKILPKLNNGVVDENNPILVDSKINKGLAFVNDISLTVGQNEIKKKDFPIIVKKEDLSSIRLYLNINGDINKPVEIEVSQDEMKNFLNVEEIKDEEGNVISYKINFISPHVVFYDIQEFKSGNLKIEGAPFYNGSLKGLDSLYSEINDYKLQLNNLARALAISVNTVHSNSTDLNEGVNFFNIEAETHLKAAKVISVNQKLKEDIFLINAGKIIDRNSKDYAAGNGERALIIGQLRNIRMEILKITSREEFLKNVYVDKDGKPLTSASLSGPNLADRSSTKIFSNNSGTTIDNYFKATISQLGVSNQEAKRMVKNQQSLVDQLVIRRESVSGVSLDEEMTNMLQFQRAYEANAKMISVIDELLDVVVNGLIRR
ncbi:flagellar hook-associated protein 1 FlgK [Caloramator fervidus]|uniref:Flagellar hook-associated protein 1 n=1 Tax=Caloramator fervidus TaxID=29344 RepID=A0A1H5WKQ9_9CLOT|nr:flagellar hook-associated protein FlgK [Caloramator fervidus]SEF99866.1 flagellar hook-associated protein 1 FlgK [Caloramator fervidus]